MVVHGDDFLIGGPEPEINKLKEEMSKKYEAKHQMMGPREYHLKKMKMLKFWSLRKIKKLKRSRKTMKLKNKKMSSLI